MIDTLGEFGDKNKKNFMLSPDQRQKQRDPMQAKKLVFCNNERYIVFMIKSFRDTWLENFFVEGTRNKKIPSTINERLFRKIQILDDSTCDTDLRSPPSNNFEKLAGNLKGRCSIRINDQWRPIFQWDNDRGEAEGVYLDNHTYR